MPPLTPHTAVLGVLLSNARRGLCCYARAMEQTPPLGSPKASPDGALDGTTKPKHSPTWFRPWLWRGAGLVVVALAYGVGRFQGAQAMTSAERQHTTAIEAVRSSLDACQIDRSLLSARRSLALVALSLDRRNFGVAESHRRDASKALEQPILSGLADVAGLSTAIGALNLSVDPDPGAKRERVIATSEALDRLLTSRALAVAPMPPASAAAVAQ